MDFNLLPFILIILGIVVLVLGRRLAVLGAAVGALVGVVILRLFPSIEGVWIELLIVLGLALVGFFFAAFARGFIQIVIQVIGALAGAGIVLLFLDLFNLDMGLLKWVLAVLGAVIGFMAINRARRGTRDWGMIILSTLVGTLLIMRGLYMLLPWLAESFLGTLVLVALVIAGIVLQGGFLGGGKAKTVTPVAPVTPPPAAPVPPPPAAPEDKQPPDQA